MSTCANGGDFIKRKDKLIMLREITRTDRNKLISKISLCSVDSMCVHFNII